MKFDLKKIKWNKVVDAINSMTKLIKLLNIFVRIFGDLIETLAVFFYKWSKNKYVPMHTL